MYDLRMPRAAPALNRRIVPSQTARSPLGRVTLAGRNCYAGPRPPWPRWRTFGQFAIAYIYEGAGVYEDTINGRRPITAGDLILVFPDLPHRYHPDADGWSEVYICFEGPVFDCWLRAGVLDRNRPVLHLEPTEHWRQRVEWVLGQSRSSGEGPPLVEVCRVQQVLAEAVTAVSASINDDWLGRAEAALSSDLGRDLRLEEIAARLGVSYASFRRRFTQATGLSPARYRAARVIDRACEMMAHTSKSDREIAAELGFCDPFHFSRRFKAVTGQTPTRFRQSLRSMAPA